MTFFSLCTLKHKLFTLSIFTGNFELYHSLPLNSPKEEKPYVHYHHCYTNLSSLYCWLVVNCMKTGEKTSLGCTMNQNFNNKSLVFFVGDSSNWRIVICVQQLLWKLTIKLLILLLFRYYSWWLILTMRCVALAISIFVFIFLCIFSDIQE